ncbi:aminotransferase class I/II-fold pyridoxal phosphate-dependent enzyme [Marinomonas sp. THO17]|uniref:aminotransferase class I/II-fold pyridoxal phosphate-dependent enzyme n=1 Tax=Marinomonas sp. THO17 TaxID=3149048 RepID=UPI00336BC833
MKKHTLAARVEQISPFQVMAVLARAKALEAQGHPVIHLEVGEPDFSAVNPVEAAGVQAILQHQTGYTAATGLPELKQAISDYYASRYHVKVAPQRIIITPGASGALLLMSSLMVNAGAEVLMPDPCYPCNRHFVMQVGGHPTMLPTMPEQDFSLTEQQVKDAWQDHTAGVWLASPANPTGAVLSKEYLASMWRTVASLGGHLLVDEIYQGLVYEGEDFTALSLSDDLFVINSFSKYFAMTGWRLGWLVVPEWAVEGATKLAQNFFISAPSVSQHAAIRAFQTDALAECEQRRQIFSKRRNVLLAGLKSLGLPVIAPAQGAFYVYVDVSEITDNAMEWCLELLEQEHVALTPGADFGVAKAHHYVRFAYANDEDKIRQALSRIGRFMKVNAA